MGAIDEALEANRRFAEDFHRPGQPRPPTRRLAVLTCMDARVQPYEMLGLRAGDAHVIRNAGGVVTEDAIRSFVISHYIGGTQEFMLIHNTKCGMTTFRDEELRQRIERETGQAAVVPERFHAFTDPAADVWEQVRKVRSHPWIPAAIRVRGFVYDVDTGRLAEVEGTPPSREPSRARV